MQPRKTLQNLLLLADAPSSSRLSADDLTHWPENLRRAIEATAILRQEAHATSINCDQCPDGGTEEVYYLGHGKATRAYINCPQCGRVQVLLERLKQCSVDLGRLALWLSKALNTQATPKTLVQERVWDLGRCSLGTSRVPVILVRGLHWQDAVQTLQPALNQTAGVLLTTSSAHLSPSWVPRGFAVTSVAEITRLNQGHLMLDRDELAELVRNRIRLKPKREKPQTTYPLPANCSLERVQIELVSNESLRIKLPNKRPHVFDYKQLGLVDRRSGERPAKTLWSALELFAVNNGFIDWNLSHGSVKHQERLVKHVQRLKQALQRFFETDKEPFYPYQREKGYRCRFVIKDARYGGSGLHD